MKTAVQFRDMKSAIHGLLIFDDEKKAERVLEKLRKIESGEAEQEAEWLQFGMDEYLSDQLNQSYAIVEEIDFRKVENDKLTAYQIRENFNVRTEEDVLHIINMDEAVDIYL